MKKRSLSFALRRCVSLSIFLAYIAMCIYWAVTGFKYGIKECTKIIIFSGKIFLTIFLLMIAVFCVYKYILLIKLKRHRLVYGCDEAFFKILKKYLGRLDSEYSKLRYARFCTEGKRYDECLKVMKDLPFYSLKSKNQWQYFNIILNNALKANDMDFADGTYKRGSFYLYRNMNLKGREDILCTMGLYSIKKGDEYWAQRYLLMANKTSKNKNVRCESALYLCRLFTETERFEAAKAWAYKAAKDICSLEQAEELKKLMLKIQDIYGVGRKERNERYDT